jgi:hypothetical protein
VSAFEILAHDEERSRPRAVLSRLDRVHWLKQELQSRDPNVLLNKRMTPLLTNLAGVQSKRLYAVRNDFLHGNLVTPEALEVGKSRFAASLLRLNFRTAQQDQ